MLLSVSAEVVLGGEETFSTDQLCMRIVCLLQQLSTFHLSCQPVLFLHLRNSHLMLSTGVPQRFFNCVLISTDICCISDYPFYHKWTVKYLELQES